MSVTVEGTLQELCTQLAEDIRKLGHNTQVLRVIGFTGPPGSGKSTAVDLIQKALQPARKNHISPLAGILPMDGFHKSNEVLELEGLTEEKGSPQTFDIVGLLMMLDRVHARSMPIYVPGYDRDLHQPIAARHRIEPRGIVLTEGNYLGLQDDAWALVREQIDLLIYLDVPHDLLHKRLLNRCILHGKTPEAANHWVRQVDHPNILRVYSSRNRANRIWKLTDKD